MGRIERRCMIGHLVAYAPRLILGGPPCEQSGVFTYVVRLFIELSGKYS